MKQPFEMAEEFHQLFDPRRPKVPTPLSGKEAGHRAGFKIEELVELLYAASDNDLTLFEELVTGLHNSVDQAKAKVLAKEKPTVDVLTEEVDALTDTLYFVYGTFSLIGVDPAPIMEIVHQANMGKLFPDGKPHYDPVTNKVLKPANWAADFADRKSVV